MSSSTIGFVTQKCMGGNFCTVLIGRGCCFQWGGLGHFSPSEDNKLRGGNSYAPPINQGPLLLTQSPGGQSSSHCDSLLGKQCNLLRVLGFDSGFSVLQGRIRDDPKDPLQSPAQHSDDNYSHFFTAWKDLFQFQWLLSHSLKPIHFTMDNSFAFLHNHSSLLFSILKLDEDVVPHTCDASTLRKLKQKDHKFQPSLVSQQLSKILSLNKRNFNKGWECNSLQRP